jgi:hypothetical protein
MSRIFLFVICSQAGSHLNFEDRRNTLGLRMEWGRGAWGWHNDQQECADAGEVSIKKMAQRHREAKAHSKTNVQCPIINVQCSIKR